MFVRNVWTCDIYVSQTGLCLTKLRFLPTKPWFFPTFFVDMLSRLSNGIFSLQKSSCWIKTTKTFVFSRISAHWEVPGIRVMCVVIQVCPSGLSKQLWVWQVSMISAHLLDTLDQCGRTCRGIAAPFGNLPVLLCGSAAQGPFGSQKADRLISPKIPNHYCKPCETLIGVDVIGGGYWVLCCWRGHEVEGGVSDFEFRSLGLEADAGTGWPTSICPAAHWLQKPCWNMHRTSGLMTDVLLHVVIVCFEVLWTNLRRHWSLNWSLVHMLVNAFTNHWGITLFLVHDKHDWQASVLCTVQCCFILVHTGWLWLIFMSWEGQNPTKQLVLRGTSYNSDCLPYLSKQWMAGNMASWWLRWMVASNVAAGRYDVATPWFVRWRFSSTSSSGQRWLGLWSQGRSFGCRSFFWLMILECTCLYILFYSNDLDVHSQIIKILL